MTGVVYVAYGVKARREVIDSILSLRRHNSLPITVISDDVPGIEAEVVFYDEPGPGARWAKLKAIDMVDYEHILYLDADTRIKGDLLPLFAPLASGWDLVCVPSVNQGSELLRHVGDIEKGDTLKQIDNPFPLQLQAGVMAYHKERCAELFKVWREEWLLWRGQDQGALLRALNRVPVRIWLFGLDFNSRHGAVVEHLFGRAR